MALDADTQFPTDTIGRLARWFDDPKVGAVAGNALVGNRVNLITRWQALEYVTAQNLERRALSALGVITVVPGAVGAWRRTAIEALGGFPSDTLAEDQDLTLAVQRAGWQVAFDTEARAYTEAPQTLKGLLKQRFRWSFGTLQCVWKHRAGLFNLKQPVLGFVALPQVWMFQIALALVAPLVDLAVVFSLVLALRDLLMHPTEWNHQLLSQTLLYWGRLRAGGPVGGGARHGVRAGCALGKPRLASGATLRLPPADVPCGGEGGDHRRARPGGRLEQAGAPGYGRHGSYATSSLRRSGLGAGRQLGGLSRPSLEALSPLMARDLM